MSLSNHDETTRKKITTSNKNYQKCPCSCLKKKEKNLMKKKKIENNDEHENVPKI